MSDQNTQNMQESTEEKLEAVPLTQSSKTLRKLDNFWYHYKWTVIVVTFFVAVAVVCLVQLFSRPKYDTSIVLATSYRMDNAEYGELEALMQSLMPKDFDGNGEKKINVVVYQYYSPAEIEQAKAEAERESDLFVINPQYNNSELNAFTNFTMTGETSVCIVSPDVYARLCEKDRVLPLSMIYKAGDMPVGTREDGKGIDLAATDLYKYNPAVAVLPNTSILCILRPSVSGYSSKEKNYEKEKLFFSALADFSVAVEE